MPGRRALDARSFDYDEPSFQLGSLPIEPWTTARRALDHRPSNVISPPVVVSTTGRSSLEVSWFQSGRVIVGSTKGYGGGTARGPEIVAGTTIRASAVPVLGRAHST